MTALMCSNLNRNKKLFTIEQTIDNNYKNYVNVFQDLNLKKKHTNKSLMNIIITRIQRKKME